MELSQIIALVAGMLVFTVLATYLAVAVPGLRMASLVVIEGIGYDCKL